MEPNYRKHLEDRKRRTLIMNGAIMDSALSQTLLSIVMLDSPEGISAFGDAIAAYWPALIDMGATYATAFVESSRLDVGTARGEGESVEAVSIVARLSDALCWMDLNQLHPLIAQSIEDGILERFQGIVLLRFPANEVGRQLGHQCVSAHGEIQVFCCPDNDPILGYLWDVHGIRYYEIRPSNLSGMPEEPFAPGAVEYACAIAAPIVAVSSAEAMEAQMIDQALYRQNLFRQMRRKRFGAFPIVHFIDFRSIPDAPPVIRIPRSGNTSPDTLLRLIKGCFPEAEIIHEEEQFGQRRNEYESPYDDPAGIQMDLIRAASHNSALEVDYE